MVVPNGSGFLLQPGVDTARSPEQFGIKGYVFSLDTIADVLGILKHLIETRKTMDHMSDYTTDVLVDGGKLV